MTRGSVVLLVGFAAVVGGALTYGAWTGRTARGGASDVPDGGTRPSEVSATAAPAASGTAVTPREHEVVALDVYFPSRRYVESGDESLPHVVAERYELEADAGTDADALARALLAKLEAGPTSASATPAIPDRLVLETVHVRDGVAHVDFARAGLSGGSLEEALLVKSIVRTLAGVPGVRAVQFLVEGKPPETLMGHVTTSKPIPVD